LATGLICTAPVIKRREDRDALRKAATSGRIVLFSRHRSAPRSGEEAERVGAAGLFNAPVAIESYAQVFAEENALDKLEAFASLNGPKHYRLPPNSETITLERASWTAPEDIKVDGPEERAFVHRGGETISWQVVTH
jgi:dihydroorotase